MSPSTNSAEMTELCDDQNVSEDNEENLRFFGPKDNWYVNILVTPTEHLRTFAQQC